MRTDPDVKRKKTARGAGCSKVPDTGYLRVQDVSCIRTCVRVGMTPHTYLRDRRSKTSVTHKLHFQAIAEQRQEPRRTPCRRYKVKLSLLDLCLSNEYGRCNIPSHRGSHRLGIPCLSTIGETIRNVLLEN